MGHEDPSACQSSPFSPHATPTGDRDSRGANVTGETRAITWRLTTLQQDAGGSACSGCNNHDDPDVGCAVLSLDEARVTKVGLVAAFLDAAFRLGISTLQSGSYS